MDYLFYFNILKEAGNSKVIENVIPFLIAWYLVRKEIRKQFTSIQESINNVAHKVEVFGVSMEKVQELHNKRLLDLENSLNTVKSYCNICPNKLKGE